MQKESFISDFQEGSQDLISENIEWQPRPKKLRQPDMAMRGRGGAIPPTGRGGGPPSRAPMPMAATSDEQPPLARKSSFGNPDQFEQEEIKKEEDVKLQQITKKQPEPTPVPSVDKGLEQRKDGFFSMITGFLGFLNTRKQAYTGKPASAMYYDEKKGRYVIAGEEESEDDEPPPPPPGRKVFEEKEPTSPKKDDDCKVQGLNALTSVGFGGALANRGRGRGRGRGAPVASRFPQALGSANLIKQEPPLEKTVDPKLYETALDISTTEITKPLEQPESMADPEIKKGHLRTSSIQSNSNQIVSQNYDKQREQMWQQNYEKQQDKIKQYKYKIQRCLNELSRQREENEQTIENFTQLCQDLKFRGMDEVEDLSSEIKLLKQQMITLSQDKAKLEFKNSSIGFEMEDLREVNNDLENKIMKLNERLLENNEARSRSIEGPASHQGLSSVSEGCEAYTKNLTYGNLQPHEAELKQIQLIKMLDLQCENEKLNWKISTHEVDTSNMVQQLQKFIRQEDEQGDTKEKLKQAEQLLSVQKEELQKAKEEILTASQKEQQVEQQEKQQLRQMITKLQQEKERVQDLQRERQTEGDQKLQQSREKINLLEQQLKKVQLEMKNTGIESSDLQKELNDQLQSKDQENQQLHKQINDLSLNTNDWQKDQVLSLQQIISSKDQQVESLKLQVEEAMTSQSNKSGVDQVRQKLNEHIIYLQNEIRKRDELLDHSDFDGDDNGSSFEDDEDDEIELRMKKYINQADPDDHGAEIEEFDDYLSDQDLRQLSRPSFKQQTPTGSQNTKKVVENQIKHQLAKANQYKKEKRKSMQQVLREQIDESRVLLKKEMESKILLEKENRVKSGKLSSLQEGISDIQTVLTDIYDKESIICMESQQATTLDDSDQDEDFVQRIISNIFEVQRFYQSKLEDLNHSLQMKTLKLEDLESLTLDLEILNQEKALTDEELFSLKMQLDLSQKQLFDKQQQMLNFEQRDSSESEKIKQKLERQINDMTLQNEREKQEIKNHGSGQINALKNHYENVLILELKDSYQRKLNQQELDSKAQKKQLDDLTDQNFSDKSQLESLNKKFQMAAQDYDGVMKELKQAKDQCQFKEIEKQELQRQIQQNIEDSAQMKKSSDFIKNQSESQKKNFEAQITKIAKEGDSRCQEIMNQRDQHKNIAKDLKSQVSKLEEHLSSELETLKTENSNLSTQIQKREDEIFWQLVNQVNSLKTEMGELVEKQQFADKNSKEINNIRMVYNEQIDELEKRVGELEQQVKEVQDEKKEELEKQTEQMEKQRVEYEAKLADTEILSELQNLLDYQLSINDKLNLKNGVLESKLESIKTAETGKQNETQKLKEQIIDLQFQAQYDQIEKSTGSEEDKSKIYQLTQNLETKTKQFEEIQQQNDKYLIENTTLIEQDLSQKQETEQMVSQFKRSAEDMAVIFKDKIKKQKEEAKKLTEEISELNKKLKKSEALDEVAFAQMQGEIDELKADKEQLTMQLESVQKEQVSLIEHLEQSRNFSFQLEDQSITNIKHNLSIFDTKIDTLTLERQKIMDCLSNAGIIIEDLDFDKILEKLQDLLQNYEEDKRQIESMLTDNDGLHKDNEELKNKNYDLRYELQEQEIKLEEAQKLMEKFEKSDPGKMVKQIQNMKEEQSVLKSDFVLKIESYEQEISVLKNQSFEKPAISADTPVSQRIVSNKYADLSVNNDLRFEGQPTEEELRIRNSPEKPKAKREPPKPQGGFLNSFASLFLTESEMSRSKPAIEAGDQSEYEYYEEYDDEDEGHMKETLDEDAI